MKTQHIQLIVFYVVYNAFSKNNKRKKIHAKVKARGKALGFLVGSESCLLTVYNFGKQFW